MGGQEIKIFEAIGKERSWFQDLLEDQGVPFRLEDEVVWCGSVKEPRFAQKQCFYVNSAYQNRLNEQIAEYNEPSSLPPDFWEEANLQPDVVQQIVCPNCGKSYDFDYPKCPYCK